MAQLRRISFILEQLALQTPAQQILDRFLLGYPRDGAWRKFTDVKMFASLPPSNEEIAMHGSPLSVGHGFGIRPKSDSSPPPRQDVDQTEIKRRVREFGLIRSFDESSAVDYADALVFISGGSGATQPRTTGLWLGSLSHGRNRPCFVYGTGGSALADAQRVRLIMNREHAPIVSGTWVPFAARLPQVDVPAGARVAEALVVVQGPKPDAELHGLDLLLALVERRRGGEAGFEDVETFAGEEVWRRGDRRAWSWPLLAAALSRSNSPQGDALKDARPQDLVSLGLVQKLARAPRGVSIRHMDGLRSTVLVLDGVVADINFAVELRSGEFISAQVLRGPPPAENHYSRLVAVIDDFFRTGKPPWPISRGVLLAEVLSHVQGD